MSNTAELAFISTPDMGHMISSLSLAKLILQRNQRISISVYIINDPHQAANAYLDSQSRDNPYPTRLTFITLPPLSNPPERSTETYFAKVIELHEPLIKQAIEDRVKAGLSKPAGFVLDMFCTGMLDIANDLSIPSYFFLTTGVSLLNFLIYSQSLVDHGVDLATEFSDPSFSSLVPGFKNPVTSKVIPQVLQGKGIWGEKLLNFTKKLRETKGVLVNTFVELESFAIQALLNSTNKNIPPVYPVGPILDLDHSSCGRSNSKDKDSVTEWLDDQPKSSVVFLCFGSIGFFDEEQVKEIANGLERSGNRFLWALRTPPPEGKLGTPNDNETFLKALPEGFLDRMATRGKIIGWASQVEVLAHPAIGGFVSHCGWNSTLESIWFGVPMATWPMYSEQQLNAFELVKELELAVEIRMDYKRGWLVPNPNFLVTSKEIENGVKNLMCMDEKMTGRVKKMSDEGKKALEKGGSSYNCLGNFIEDVLSNVA